MENESDQDNLSPNIVIVFFQPNIWKQLRVKISDINFEWRFDGSLIIFTMENDVRIIETSFKIIISNFYSQLFVQNPRC